MPLIWKEERSGRNTIYFYVFFFVFAYLHVCKLWGCCQPLTFFEPYGKKWFPMALGPRSFSLSHNIPFQPYYKYYFFFIFPASGFDWRFSCFPIFLLTSFVLISKKYFLLSHPVSNKIYVAHYLFDMCCHIFKLPRSSLFHKIHD